MGEIIMVTPDNLIELIDESDILVLAFGAVWCETCHVFNPFYAKVAAENPQITCSAINVDAEPELTALLGVRLMPTLMAFVAGVPVYNQAGVPTEDGLRHLFRLLEEVDPEEVKAAHAAQQAARAAEAAEAAEALEPVDPAEAVKPVDPAEEEKLSVEKIDDPIKLIATRRPVA